MTLRKYPGKNATIWIAYVNKDIIKLNKFPKFALSLLTRPEDELAGAKNSFQAIKTYYTRAVNLIRYTWGQSDQLELPDYTQKILTRGAAIQQKRKERMKKLKKLHPRNSNAAQEAKVNQASTARISEHLENTAEVPLPSAKPNCDVISHTSTKEFHNNHTAAM